MTTVIVNACYILYVYNLNDKICRLSNLSLIAETQQQFLHAVASIFNISLLQLIY